MNIRCVSCLHDFAIDERLIDTDSIDCPRCTCTNHVDMRGLRNASHWFVRQGNQPRGPGRLWLSRRGKK